MPLELIHIFATKKEVGYPTPLHYIQFLWNPGVLLNFCVIIQFFIILIGHSI
jgi:hypothetical protein